MSIAAQMAIWMGLSALLAGAVVLVARHSASDATATGDLMTDGHNQDDSGFADGTDGGYCGGDGGGD